MAKTIISWFVFIVRSIISVRQLCIAAECMGCWCPEGDNNLYSVLCIVVEFNFKYVEIIPNPVIIYG